MTNKLAAGELLERIHALEREVSWAIEEQERRLGYRLVAGQVRFTEEMERLHARLRTWLPRYLADARLLAIVTAPLIYACAAPMLLVDLFISVYQAICFSVYGIPKVSRADYIVFDRGRLKYLNLLERLNCIYCSYANGLFAYCAEIAARTEQHWCPIKHSERLRAPHSRYAKFFDFGDATAYHERLEDLRHDFEDLNKPAAGETRFPKKGEQTF